MKQLLFFLSLFLAIVPGYGNSNEIESIQDTTRHKKIWIQNDNSFDDVYYRPNKDSKKTRLSVDTIKVQDTIINDNPKIEYEESYDNKKFNDVYYRDLLKAFNYQRHYYSLYYWNAYYYDWYYPYYYWDTPYHMWHLPYYYEWNYSYYWIFSYHMQHSSYYYEWNHFYWDHPYHLQDYPMNYGTYDNHNNYHQWRPNRTSNLTQPRQVQTEHPSYNQVKTNSQIKPLYQQNRRNYTPSYQSPVMNTHPNYNNTRTNNTHNTYSPPSRRQSSDEYVNHSYSNPERNNTNNVIQHRSSNSNSSNNNFSGGNGNSGASNGSKSPNNGGSTRR